MRSDQFSFYEIKMRVRALDGATRIKEYIIRLVAWFGNTVDGDCDRGNGRHILPQG